MVGNIMFMATNYKIKSWMLDDSQHYIIWDSYPGSLQFLIYYMKHVAKLITIYNTKPTQLALTAGNEDLSIAIIAILLYDVPYWQMPVSGTPSDDASLSRG